MAEAVVPSSPISLGEKINNITREINHAGIKKNVDIAFSGKKFKGRGIDEIVMHLTPLFSKHGLILSFDIIKFVDIETSVIVHMEFRIHDSEDLSKFLKYSVCGEGQKSSSARAVQIAQTYALKTFFSHAFFISEGWDESTDVEEKPMNINTSIPVYIESYKQNAGITYHEFPAENLYLVDFVIKEVLDSHSLSALMKVFNKYKHDFMQTDKETEFLNYFSVRKKELEALVNDPKE